MIDLRSDTLTKPSKDMLKAIVSEDVGDDVFGEDPTTNRLQHEAAELFGKEAALFVSSGVMGNQLAIKALTDPGDEVIVESQSHIFYYETAAPSVISSVQLRPLDSPDGHIPINAIANAIRPADYYFPKTRLICIENTHNRHSGTIIKFDYIKQLHELTKSKGLFLHLDGARIWNALIETAIKPDEFAQPFDTLSVCLSKGLGAPVGSLLLGTKDVIEKAHRWRKILGGGMRQTGILAAAGLFAIKNNVSRLKDDHINAKAFADAISQIRGISVENYKVQTNIVCFDLNKSINIQSFLESCKQDGLLMLPFGLHTVRAVFNYHINVEMTQKAIEIVRKNALN